MEFKMSKWKTSYNIPCNKCGKRIKIGQTVYYDKKTDQYYCKECSKGN